MERIKAERRTRAKIDGLAAEGSRRRDRQRLTSDEIPSEAGEAHARIIIYIKYLKYLRAQAHAHAHTRTYARTHIYAHICRHCSKLCR